MLTKLLIILILLVILDILLHHFYGVSVIGFILRILGLMQEAVTPPPGV